VARALLLSNGGGAAMRMGQQHWTRVKTAIVLAVAMLVMPCAAHAQDQDRPSAFWDVTKRVIFDPTTYAPAIIAYDATMRDWNSSQPFFQNGFLEHNPRFTISGRPNDLAITYGAGRKRILSDALSNVELSLANNVVDNIFERVLVTKYPNHRKLVRTLGWIEKIGFASYTSYRLSAAHYRQWQQNESYARQLGLK
jgi:pimeloyl-ACP methyl ester carboxylesterase